MTGPRRRAKAQTNDIAQEKPITKDGTAAERADAETPNPRRTTTGGWFTAPKFGSAGSGGAELEPGPERD